MVNLLKIFNRYKMKAKELQQENEGLKAQIIGLSFNLQQADKQIQFLQSELDKAKQEDSIEFLKSQIFSNQMGQA